MSEHTPGAIRAAEIITGGNYDPAERLTQPTYDTAFGRKTLAGIAAIIDAETGAPKLLEACRAVLRDLTYDDDGDVVLYAPEVEEGAEYADPPAIQAVIDAIAAATEP